MFDIKKKRGFRDNTLGFQIKWYGGVELRS